MQMQHQSRALARSSAPAASRLALPGHPALLRHQARGKLLIPSSTNYGGGGGYYPSVPSQYPSSASDPAYAPSAPPFPSEPSSPYGTSNYSAYAPSDADTAAAMEFESLRAAANTTKTLSFLSFWAQFALSIVSAGILFFSVAFVPRVPGVGGAVDITKYLTLVGVITAFISALFSHGFYTLSRKLLAGGNVARNYLSGTLLTNNAICLAGIAITVIGLQASVGTLVGKTLITAINGPLTVQNANTGLVSLDVFALQASTNVLLCHVIGLFFTNVMLRIVGGKKQRGGSGGASAAPLSG